MNLAARGEEPKGGWKRRVVEEESEAKRLKDRPGGHARQCRVYSALVSIFRIY